MRTSVMQYWWGRSVWLLFAVILVSSASLGGCTAQRATLLEPAGFVVIGPRWASELSGMAGDTLREVGARSVDASLRAAAESLARQESIGEAECNRYFRAESRVLVLFADFCGENRGAQCDSRVFVILESHGEVVRVFRSWGQNEVARIEPYLRLF